jgi:hypothetical protein
MQPIRRMITPAGKKDADDIALAFKLSVRTARRKGRLWSEPFQIEEPRKRTC